VTFFIFDKIYYLATQHEVDGAFANYTHHVRATRRSGLRHPPYLCYTAIRPALPAFYSTTLHIRRLCQSSVMRYGTCADTRRTCRRPSQTGGSPIL